jgi:hypothetical protein
MISMSSISRREMLKLGSVGSLAALAGVAPDGVAEALAQTTQRIDPSTQATVSKWNIFEITLPGPSSGNPFTEVELTATFALGHRTVAVDGFYDGDGSYKIRFMPDAEGEWSYTTASGAAALDGLKGTVSLWRGGGWRARAGRSA